MKARAHGRLVLLSCGLRQSLNDVFQSQPGGPRFCLRLSHAVKNSQNNCWSRGDAADPIKIHQYHRKSSRSRIENTHPALWALSTSTACFTLYMTRQSHRFKRNITNSNFSVIVSNGEYVMMLGTLGTSCQYRFYLIGARKNNNKGKPPINLVIYYGQKWHPHPSLSS